MESIPFLTIDNQTISWKRALQYLNASGELQQFIYKIVQQYIIDQELQYRKNALASSEQALEVDPLQIDQAIMDFRLQKQLVNLARFEEWLQSQRTNYTQFRNQIATALKIEKLKAEITNPKTEEHFNKNKELLNRVVLSRLVVNDQELAEHLKSQILADESRFETLAREHSLTDDRLVQGSMVSVRLGQLQEPVREALKGAKVGDIIGPVAVEGRYCVLRLEQFQPASLEGQLKQELQNQLFEQWITEKAQKMIIKLHMP